MKDPKKIKLTPSEEKRAVSTGNFDIEPYGSGCRVFGKCDNGHVISCIGIRQTACFYTSTTISCTVKGSGSGSDNENEHLVSISCSDFDNSSSDSGSGSDSKEPTNEYDACIGKDLMEKCSWKSNGLEHTGRCLFTPDGKKKYCVSGVKKKL